MKEYLHVCKPFWKLSKIKRRTSTVIEIINTGKQLQIIVGLSVEQVYNYLCVRLLDYMFLFVHCSINRSLFPFLIGDTHINRQV